MAAARVAEVAVADRGRLVGMLSQRHVAAAHPSAATTLTALEIGAYLDRLPVARIMTTDIAAVGAATPIAEAVGLMRAKRLDAVPVVRGDRLLGVVTRGDALALLEALLGRDGAE